MFGITIKSGAINTGAVPINRRPNDDRIRSLTWRAMIGGCLTFWLSLAGYAAL